MGINSYTIVNRIEAAVAKPVEGTLVTGFGGASVPLSASELFVTKLELYGYKAVAGASAPTANSANAYLGSSGAMTDTIAPGARVEVQIPLGGKLNLATLFANGTAGDGLYIRYMR
jgi:hypothetical protein